MNNFGNKSELMKIAKKAEKKSLFGMKTGGKFFSKNLFSHKNARKTTKRKDTGFIQPFS
ncbi:hypothetical protein [Rubellicoccus peritrichatus]|uniref:Uncharacterized protein n=1 Tax=Rubellicoccus peritrichatus TaxID=3080537 RepID=A0AAQ3L8X9_9BACT|nr:hypothetical protein [Puniceicoccus sp. CR14]WOO41271.1 hypothetical protein RZN69_21840 [Puniceicoccus sp. CR14]